MQQEFYTRILKYCLILFIAAIFFFPLYWTLTMVFKSYHEWSTAHGAAIQWWPTHFNLDNITYLFQRQTHHSPLAATATRPLINSIIVSFTGTALAVVLGVLAAYGVSRYKANKEFPLMLLTLRMFPPVAVLIPPHDHVGLSKIYRYLVRADPGLWSGDTSLLGVADADLFR